MRARNGETTITFWRKLGLRKAKFTFNSTHSLDTDLTFAMLYIYATTNRVPRKMRIKRGARYKNSYKYPQYRRRELRRVLETVDRKEILENVKVDDTYADTCGLSEGARLFVILPLGLIVGVTAFVGILGLAV